ncbi:LysR substrate-binding domain-containing protein [Roseovarius salis]|uniref:LysR substrate-binding domain-containing protein n=1 Tax=Roseovarius salis TaxID=3376063 RepID=UPI0037C67408
MRVFEAAARCESFARAADELNMSAAAVSQQVRALEERVGSKLFIRRAHAVRLTEVGRAYLPGVQQALLTVQAATEGLFGPARAQQLYVESSLIFAHGVLAPQLAAFEAAAPQVALMLTTANDITEIVQRYADLQVIFGNPLSFGSEGDFLLGERLYPVARPEVAAAIEAPQDLLAHRLIEVTTHRAGWAYMLGELGVAPRDVRHAYADNTRMAMALASEGMGVALARAPASDKAMREAGLVACLPGVEVEGREGYHLVYPDRASLRPPATAFRGWLMGLCKRL